MLTINDCMDINWAKVEGEMFRGRFAAGICEEILEKIRDLKPVDEFRKALFNAREPVLFVSINRRRLPNDTDADMTDIHDLLIETGGYERLASELNYINLSYSIQTEGILQLRLTYAPPPPLPASDESSIEPEDDHIRRVLDFQQEMRGEEETMEWNNRALRINIEEIVNDLTSEQLSEIEDGASRGWC